MFRAFRHRDYRLYYFGQGLSLIGSWMQTTALAWLAFQLTGQSSWSAAVAVGMILPTALLAPVAGLLADRMSKKQLILWTQSAFAMQATGLACYGLWGHATPMGLVLFAWLGGVVQAVDLPTRLSFLKELTSLEDLPNAVALNSVQFNLARALGPALAGWIMSIADPALCFAINAFSYLAVLGCLASIRVRGEPIAKGAGYRGNMELLTALKRQPTLAGLIALAAGVALFGWPLLSLLPQVASVGLGWQAEGHGWLLSALGAGAMLSALAIAAWGQPDNLWWRLRLGLLLLAMGELVLAWVARAGDGPLTGGLAGSTLAGMGLILVLASAQGAVQQQVDDAIRGRMMALWTMGLSTASPIGSVLFGPLADWAGHSAALLVMAIGVLVLLSTCLKR